MLSKYTIDQKTQNLYEKSDHMDLIKSLQLQIENYEKQQKEYINEINNLQVVIENYKMKEQLILIKKNEEIIKEKEINDEFANELKEREQRNKEKIKKIIREREQMLRDKEIEKEQAISKKIKYESNLIHNRFIDDNIIKGNIENKITIKELYKAFNNWFNNLEYNYNYVDTSNSTIIEYLIKRIGPYKKLNQKINIHHDGWSGFMLKINKIESTNIKTPKKIYSTVNDNILNNETPKKKLMIKLISNNKIITNDIIVKNEIINNQITDNTNKILSRQKEFQNKILSRQKERLNERKLSRTISKKDIFRIKEYVININ